MKRFIKQLDQSSTSTVGLLQGLGVTLYILVFAAIMMYLQCLPDPEPPLAIILFLLLFITSALACGTMVLGYPLILVFNKNIRRAIAIVGWSAATLLAATLLTVLVILLVA